MRRTTLEETRELGAVVYLGLELGLDKWVLCFSNGAKRREIRLQKDDCRVDRLLEEAKKARRALRMPANAKAVCCYEAGRHGFSVHRQLVAAGVESLVVDSASIEVPRKQRRTKTDRIDARKLVQLLIRYVGGETDALHVVRVPSVDEEDERRPTREYLRLKKERTAHTNRIKALLLLMGVRVKGVAGEGFIRALEKMRQQSGEPLPAHLVMECRRTHERRELVEKQLKELAQARHKRVPDPRRRSRKKATPIHRSEHDEVAEKVELLSRLVGVGVESAWILVTEFFGWRKFRNRRQVVAAAGLAPTLHASCTVERHGHISKAGNPRVRWLMQQLAWSWTRLQPQSRLSQWKAGRTGKTNKKSLTVAVAGRLLVDLWRFVEFGVIPEGALLREP